MVDVAQFGELSLQERDRRYALIRASMRERRLEALIIWGNSAKWDSKSANIRYISQIGGNGEEAMAIFPLEGEPTVFLWSPIMRGEWLESQQWVKNLLARRPNWSEVVVQRLKEMALERSSIGVVGLEGREPEGDIPYVTYSKILQACPGARFENATDLLEEVRLVKSDAEIALIKEAMRIGDVATEVMYRMSRPGAREREIFAEMVGTMLREGAEHPIMFLWDSGAPDRARRLTYNRNRLLKAGDVICTEFAPRVQGYYGHFQRAVAVADPSPPYGELLETSALAYERGMKAARAGITVGEFYDACAEPILSRGFEIYKGPLFHGIGLGWETPLGMPGMSEQMRARKLVAGMTLAIEVGAATEGKARGVHLGDVVVVKDKGVESLSRLPVEMVSCG